MYRTPEIPADSGWSPELIENLLKSLQAMRSNGLNEQAQALFFRSALRSDAICQRLAAYKSASPTEREAILGELLKFVEEHFPPKEEVSAEKSEEVKSSESFQMDKPPPRKPENRPDLKIGNVDDLYGAAFSWGRLFGWGVILFGIPIAIGAGWGAAKEREKREAVRQEEIKAETEAVVQACLHQDYSGPCMASCMPFTYRNDLPCSCYGHLMVKDVPVRCVQK
jgi:hypothetical protein